MKTLYELVHLLDDFFGIKQLINFLNKSDSTIRRIINTNKLIAYKTSNIYYFKKEDLIQFLIAEAI
ncbi:helix-turn-helix domain-containing protein [uncultured Cetobacterium sp.]|uniref:helix-turn-helix domain-containing protein n=1 Tax=uncultured Cetobacterium sp. TaxID=527638 RepID=UPI0025E9E723|nr:helix-turn-helix domain-containing protein [uncultured Cetobacterium sp.]